MTGPAWLKDAAVIDYESLPIRGRPLHPPAPVGVAIEVPGKKPTYYAWGHPDGNTPGAWSAARQVLGQAYDSGRPLLFHNCRFDVDVGEAHMGLPELPWDRYHDTLPALFLADPRAQTYGLKPSAERILGQAPDERDAVEEWLLANQPLPGVKLSKSKKSDKYVGAHIGFSPPSVAGPYALGDLSRTRGIAELVFAEVERRGMWAAYDRERRLLPRLLSMERQGLRVDLQRLERDLERYTAELARLEEWLRRKLRSDESLNLDSGEQLAAALIKTRLATEADFGKTPTGKMQTNKEALAGAVKDPQVLAVLKYRTQLGTCLNTFMRPWADVAATSGGLIFTEWHSTRRDQKGGGVGTRTGRLSSTPNWQNIPKEFKAIFKSATDKDSKLPPPPFAMLPLPLVRSYVIPYEKDHVLIDRDFSSQELRVLAHFEDDAIKKAYLDDPNIDLHQYVADMVAQKLGIPFVRKDAKTVNFAILYGVGLGHLAELLGQPVDQAKRIRGAYFAAFPSVRRLIDELTERGRAGKPIRTWGGREYYAEPPALIDGRMRDFYYKLLNYLIQGSSADLTKEALLDFEVGETRVYATVHDEILASAPKATWKQDMARLKEAMNRPRLDVPMLSDGAVGPNWEEMKECD